jgi:hypothetical protein
VASGSYQDSELVFATAKGTPLDAQNLVDRHFKPLLKRAGLPDTRWHDLRHSCFTLLLSRRVHPKYVQHLTGHASVQLTLGRHPHRMPTLVKHTASATDEALAEADCGEAALVIEASTVGIASLHERLAEARIEQERMSVIQHQIDVIDRQIDRLLYDLYGLTGKEVRIVEESTS